MTQQEKMSYCNKEAGAKKLEGDARKTFMSECLSAEGTPASTKAMTQPATNGLLQ